MVVPPRARERARSLEHESYPRDRGMSWVLKHIWNGPLNRRVGADIDRGTAGHFRLTGPDTLDCLWRDGESDIGVPSMARQREFRVLLATDGSRGAEAAIATTLHFPWPARTRVRAISARSTRADRRSILLTAPDRGAEMAADSARRTLSRRWPDVEAAVLDKPPI